MPDAYLIVESEVTDPAAFALYMAKAPAAVKAFAATYLARGGRMNVLEGNWAPKRLTVIRFPSFEAAENMYNSEQYVAARLLRQGTTACFNMVLVEGVEALV